MDAVRKDVEKLVVKELESANKKFPLFNSMHEAAAVILEEVEEQGEASAYMQCAYNNFWHMVRNDMNVREADLLEVRDGAVCAAVEAIQVAAMAEKTINSMKGVEKDDHTNRTKDN